MTGGEAVDYIQRWLGYRSDQDANILVELNAAMREMERGHTLPRFLIQYDQDLNFTANVNYVALPTGFLRIVEDDYPSYTNNASDLVYLKQAAWDDLRLFYAGTSLTEPKGFTIRNERMYVAPTPSTATTLTWSYYKAGDEITSGGENAWMQNSAYPFGSPYLLIGMAGGRLANGLGATDRVKSHFAELEAREARRMLNDTYEADMNGPVTMGGG